MAYDRQVEQEDDDADNDGLNDAVEAAFEQVNDKTELNHLDAMNTLKAIKMAVKKD